MNNDLRLPSSSTEAPPANPCVFATVVGSATCLTHRRAFEHTAHGWRCPIAGFVFPFGTAFGTVAAPVVPPARIDREKLRRRLDHLARKAASVFEGFRIESLNGVVCSIPDEGLDLKPHRTWCAACQARWRSLETLVKDLDALADSVEVGAASVATEAPQRQETKEDDLGTRGETRCYPLVSGPPHRPDGEK